MRAAASSADRGWLRCSSFLTSNLTASSTLTRRLAAPTAKQTHKFTWAARIEAEIRQAVTEPTAHYPAASLLHRIVFCSLESISRTSSANPWRADARLEAGPAICRGVRAKQGMASAIARHNRSSAPVYTVTVVIY